MVHPEFIQQKSGETDSEPTAPVAPPPLASTVSRPTSSRIVTGLILITPAGIALWVLWHQSLELYAANGFADPLLVTAGAMVFLAGSAIVHALSRSRLALLLCFYAGGYEMYFMAAGTLKGEVRGQVELVAQNPRIAFAASELERARAEYERYRARFDSEGSDVNQNGWFKKNYVDPAWERYAASRESFERQKSEVSAKVAIHDPAWLKVSYRLGLVLFVMYIVHILAGSLAASRPRGFAEA